MVKSSSSSSAGSGAVSTALEAKTPYQHALEGLRFPMAAALGFNTVAALGFGLIGWPLLALGWMIVSTIVDAGLQGLYSRLEPSAPHTASAPGLRRLAACSFLRASVWMSAPTALAVATHGPAAIAFLGTIAVMMVAIAVTAGWSSPGVSFGWLLPPVVGLAAPAFGSVGVAPAIGVLLGMAMFVAAGFWIGAATRANLAEWSRSNERTHAALDELKAALARSEAAEHRFRIAAEIADLHVFEADFVNKTAVALNPDDDFLEEPISFEAVAADGFYLVHPDDRERAMTAWQAYTDGHGPYRLEHRLKRADGEERWIFVASELTRDEGGEPQSLVCAMLNITERKRAERELMAARDRAEAASRAKDQFLATMSHEVRTPLNGVIGMAQAMEGEKLTGLQRKRVQVIRRSGEVLLELLNNVLDLSRIESGAFQLEPGVVDVTAMAQAVVDSCRAPAEEKGVQLILSTAPGAAGRYAADPARLSQVLHNLLSNAVKFTERGRIEVRLSRDGGELAIEVADTGLGIAPDQLESLFEKFVQADSSTTRRFGGAGLGLTITRELVEIMGGAITVDSALGQGSTFRVTLPLPRVCAAQDEAAAAGSPAAAARAPVVRVLAAEDNEVNQLVLKTLLDQVGLAAVVVENGEEAVKAWSEGMWDIILMDIQMPLMDGVMATQAIRAQEAAAGRPRTPIVAITANVMSHQVSQYMQAGMDAVVAKPLRLETLLETMAAALEPQEPSAAATPRSVPPAAAH